MPLRMEWEGRLFSVWTRLKTGFGFFVEETKPDATENTLYVLRLNAEEWIVMRCEQSNLVIYFTLSKYELPRLVRALPFFPSVIKYECDHSYLINTLWSESWTAYAYDTKNDLKNLPLKIHSIFRGLLSLLFTKKYDLIPIYDGLMSHRWIKLLIINLCLPPLNVNIHLLKRWREEVTAMGRIRFSSPLHFPLMPPSRVEHAQSSQVYGRTELLFVPELPPSL